MRKLDYKRIRDRKLPNLFYLNDRELKCRQYATPIGESDIKNLLRLFYCHYENSSMQNAIDILHVISLSGF